MSLFVEFSFLLVVAAAMAFLMRLLRQPLIIGHIMTGLLVGPFALDLLQSVETLKLFSEMGIAFLLFTVGLGLNPGILKQFGKVALITGVGQVVVTGVVGVALCLALGFSLVTSLYISIAFAFSSTIIILKLISDKGDLEKLYAKIAIGFLLVQDIIAIILLFALPILSAESGSFGVLARTLLKASVVTLAVFAVSHILVRRMQAYLARSQEFMFLFAAAWGIGIAALFLSIGFSIEIGALIAGVALAFLPSRHEIMAHFTPLRDFFIVVFFVLLGSQMVFADVMALLVPAIILSLLVLIGNPLILLVIMGLLGYKRKTSLQTGFTVAQISEFSLILIALGVQLGQVPQAVLSMSTLVGLVTIFGSTYFVLYSDTLYKWFAPYLKMFERRNVVEVESKKKKYTFFLFGANRVGFDFLETFKHLRKPFLVVDHDPEIIGQLLHAKVEHRYGDGSDLEFLETLELRNADIVVSTIPDVETNLLIAREAKRVSPEQGRRGAGELPTVMAVAHNISNALELYDGGVDYVILPHFLGGRYASSMVHKFFEHAEAVEEAKKEQLDYLKKRSTLGHEHPMIDRFR
ncbi:MAG: hypothetical protein A2945_04445 [Candidatus Liptonbacteria bacterium RIFCSPLOWO2_01_FULL_52_25]|uniref:RCK N-terminal domain-containing protein n=1 Tax=Candidatus Liptonbacteria bacterium RIFCSPLOWO2_01_FULL_52_25 TaxID=1798650 RepID=A0A1G2CFS2_9BACT|nr:MAG: hypothetical protein A2945_04445 [Candidatus Liptonbacteria bacterium RIFCSPLOWO2_01_FULL_52_25]